MLTVPGGFEGRATASPPDYIGNIPSRTQTLHQSHCVCLAALDSGPPGPSTAGRGPSVALPAPNEPGGTVHTWLHGWRGPKGRSSGPRKRWRTCPCGCTSAEVGEPGL